MPDKDYERISVEYDIDTKDPREIIIKIKSDVDMDGKDFYDALHCYLHDILEPEVFDKCKDISQH